MLPHPLTNFKIQKYHQNEPNFNGVHSRNNLPKIKFGEYESIGTHWTALYVIAENVRYIDIPTKIRKFIGNTNITTNIYRR